MLRSQAGTERVFVRLGREDKASNVSFWFDPKGLNETALSNSHGIISDLMFAASPEAADLKATDDAMSPRAKEVLSSDGLWRLRIKATPTRIKDVPMMRIDVDGPWPAGSYWDRPSAKAVPLTPYVGLILPLWAVVITFLTVPLLVLAHPSENGSEACAGIGRHEPHVRAAQNENGAQTGIYFLGLLGSAWSR